MSDADYLYALEMQKRWNAEGNEGDSDIEEVDFKQPRKKPLQIKRSNPHSNLDEDYLNRTQNLVHPQWETLDPTPDIFSLFGNFDTKFFQGRLKCVTLEWSKRMYSCAGICYSRRNRYGMDVTIRLSEPLLKLRPRKDLIETMLHEMIHAYCFVLNIREGNGGHGPNFKKIMSGINKVAGTNITVYHTFHDEVDLYKQHWWRCNGSCQNRSPFFGYVKRTSNRAPGPNDQWWVAHLESCGGTFMKIKEPEKKKREKSSSDKGKHKTGTGSDLRKYFSPTNTSTTTPKTKSNNSFSTGGNSGGGFKGPIKINGGGTMLLNSKIKTNTNSNNKPAASQFPVAAAFPPTSYPGLSSDPFNAKNSQSPGAIVPAGGNLRNVKGFRDLAAGNDCSGGGVAGRAITGPKSTPNNAMVGRGYSLDSSSNARSQQSSMQSSNNQNGHIDRNHLREVWAKRFGSNNNNSIHSKQSRYNDTDNTKKGDAKRRRVSTDGPSTSANASYVAINNNGNSNDWVVLDDDIMLQDQPNEVIAILSDDDGDNDDMPPPPARRNKKPLTSDERQTAIKKEILEETVDLEDDDIVLIDDEYDDAKDLDISTAAELADTSVIDEFFGDDTLLKEFTRENDVKPTGSHYMPNPEHDIITCPICQGKMKRNAFGEHLDGCTGIAIKIQPPKHALKKLSSTSREIKPTRRSGHTRQTAKDILRNAGYSEQDLANITSASSNDEDDFQSSSVLTSSPLSQPSEINSDSTDENTKRYRQRNLFKTTRQCPVCALEIEEDEINEHLDECLKK